MKNSLAKVFAAVGTLIFFFFGYLGVIAGRTIPAFTTTDPFLRTGDEIPAFAWGDTIVQQDFNWYAGVPLFVTGFIIGLLFIGVAEIIELLQKNVNANEAVMKNQNHRSLEE